MFDCVRCEYPLPDPSHQNVEFQTKNLLNEMEGFTITREGRLFRRGRCFGEGLSARAVHEQWPLHGDLHLLGSDAHSGEDVDYLVRFTHGLVEEIRRVSNSDEEPLEGYEMEIGLPASVLLMPVVPTLGGRKITAEEFALHAPKRLELIDGMVSAGPSLLALLLANLGLRRAARMTARSLWEQAGRAAERATNV